MYMYIYMYVNSHPCRSLYSMLFPPVLDQFCSRPTCDGWVDLPLSEGVNPGRGTCPCRLFRPSRSYKPQQ